MDGQPSATLDALQARFEQQGQQTPDQVQQHDQPVNPATNSTQPSEHMHTEPTIQHTQQQPLLISAQHGADDVRQAGDSSASTRNRPVPSEGGSASQPYTASYASSHFALIDHASSKSRNKTASWFPIPNVVPSVSAASAQASLPSGSVRPSPRRSQQPAHQNLLRPQPPKSILKDAGTPSLKRTANEKLAGARPRKTVRLDTEDSVAAAKSMTSDTQHEQPNTTTSDPTKAISSMVESSIDALLERQMDMQDASSESDTQDRRSRRNGRGRGNHKPRRQGGGQRGPRKAAEPTGDVKYRLDKALHAYTDQKFDEAIEWVQDAIRINAETYRAWMLLVQILDEKGDKKESFLARVFSCHLQPKNVAGWLTCAEIGVSLQEELSDDIEEIADKTQVCWAAALKADPSNRPARHGRAAISSEKGLARGAARDYLYLLNDCGYDVYALRGYGEIAITLATARKPDTEHRKNAIKFYRDAISHFREDGIDEQYPFEWQDIAVFTDLLTHDGDAKDAIRELKSLSRWLLGRSDESYWDDWQDDDREWDIENERRIDVADYQEGKFPSSSYGSGLPLDLRAKLAVYRLKAGDSDEAQKHIRLLEPDGPNGPELLSNLPFVLAVVAMATYKAGKQDMALRFFESVLPIPDVLDASGLLAAGRSYLEAENKRQAEACFTAAMDVDEGDDEAAIDARYELAKMYEEAREDREAYILVNEAIRLQQAHDKAGDGPGDGADDARLRQEYASGLRNYFRGMQPTPGYLGSIRARPIRNRTGVSRRPRTYRRKVFARTEEVQAELDRKKQQVATAWAAIYIARETPGQESGPSESFMQAAKDLFDDFRSCKTFFSWEKYLKNLGLPRDEGMMVSRNPNLIDMRERLQLSVVDNDFDTDGHQNGWRSVVGYRGVPFKEWLEVFLEYALALAHLEKYEEAYKVCESARDAACFKPREDIFLIHVVWAACGLRARDEETCVASARMIMRSQKYESDPFRLFSALCRLCPSPASWYASGPVQKFIMRQIKVMDTALRPKDKEGDGVVAEDEESSRTYASKELDATLLCLYGHILFVSNSFTYALNYFLRAYSVDPNSPMIQLSIGQCYIHYALKRQSENRQYLLVQGFTFLHRYYEVRAGAGGAAERQEAHYNMARSYHAIGINHLAALYYQRALQDAPSGEKGEMPGTDISKEAAFNLQQICLAGGDMEGIRAIGEKYLTV